MPDDRSVKVDHPSRQQKKLERNFFRYLKIMDHTSRGSAAGNASAANTGHRYLCSAAAVSGFRLTTLEVGFNSSG